MPGPKLRCNGQSPQKQGHHPAVPGFSRLEPKCVGRQVLWSLPFSEHEIKLCVPPIMDGLTRKHLSTPLPPT